MTNLGTCVIVVLIVVILVLYWSVSMSEKYWIQPLYDAGPAFPPPYNMNGLLTSVRTGNLL